eukprot:5919010-Alexandrium_andersonii.AAC.1
MLAAISKQCPGDHQHQVIEGSAASFSAGYPPGLCKAIGGKATRGQNWNTWILASSKDKSRFF